MILGMPFHTFMELLITIAVLAQIYLFLRIRRVVGSLSQSNRFKALLLGLVGTAIVLLFATNLYIMFNSIPWVDPSFEAQLFLFYPPTVWGLGSIFSALVLCLLQLAGCLAKIMVGSYRKLATHPISVPVNQERRRFLQVGVGGLATAPFLLFGYGAASAGKASQIQELALPFGCSLRVVKLTDIHAGIYMNREEMRRYADTVNALKPDLFVLTGDFISNSLISLPGCL